MRSLLERRASSFLFAAGGLCAISAVSPAHAQVSDLGSVDILGRTFNCPSLSCDGLVQEATPGAYASNRDVGFSTKLGTDVYGQETYLWVFGDTPVYRRPSASSAYEPLSGGLFSTNSAGLTFYNPWASQPSLTGPWSAPRPITLPASCNAATSQGCYAPSLHAELGDASSLGLTFVDRDGLTVAGGQKVQLMRYGALASSALPAP